MRLWTVHPRYLDAQGLVASWREALLAQKVLAGGTIGYRSHPQLCRFRSHSQPLACIAAFLVAIADEAQQRGYQFDRLKIGETPFRGRLSESRGQLQYEWRHLKRKLRARAPQVYRRILGIRAPDPHPLFRIVDGPVQDWERV